MGLKAAAIRKDVFSFNDLSENEITLLHYLISLINLKHAASNTDDAPEKLPILVGSLVIAKITSIPIVVSRLYYGQDKLDEEVL